MRNWLHLSTEQALQTVKFLGYKFQWIYLEKKIIIIRPTRRNYEGINGLLEYEDHQNSLPVKPCILTCMSRFTYHMHIIILVTTGCGLLKINNLYEPKMKVIMEHCLLQNYWIWWLTAAYATILGNPARTPVPSAYTHALIKTSFSTCKLGRELIITAIVG